MELTTSAAVGSESGVESLQAAGDVLIEELILTKNGQDTDIRNFSISLTLFEDLFSNVLMGELDVSDAVGMISMLPLLGGELVSFTARTPSATEVIRRSMVIVGVKNRVLDTKQQVYTLMLMSPEGALDNVFGISRSFKGTTDQILSRVFSTYLQYPRYARGTAPSGPSTLNMMGAPHQSKLEMVSPYWTPMKIMNWIAARSITSQGKAPNVLFYETNKGFYAHSIEDLIAAQRDAGNLFTEYFFAQAAVRDHSSGNFSYTLPDVARQFSIIQNLAFPESSDWLKAQDFGHYAGTLVTHDIVLKRYREHTWDYFANFNKFGHMESYSKTGDAIVQNLAASYPTFSGASLRSPNSYRGFKPKHYSLFNGYEDNGVEFWSLQRNSLLHDLSAVRFEIQVPGRTDIEAGRLVFIHMPKGATTSPEFGENFDPLLTGVYLITAIRHQFSLTGKHTMTLEVAKDSFRQKV